MHVGCITGRRFALLITVRNKTKDTITLVGGGGPQRAPNVINRVAVQVKLAPPPPKGDIFIPGLRSWLPISSGPVDIPAGLGAWVQSNFLMNNCASLKAGQRLIVNRSITLAYRDGETNGSQTVSVRGARIILTRGPVHPTLPINTEG
jgi:hypothetical protein